MKQVISNNKAILATNQEIEIVQLLANDNRKATVAQILNVKPRTLDGRVERLKGKFGLKTMAAAVALFFRNKLIE